MREDDWRTIGATIREFIAWILRWRRRFTAFKIALFTALLAFLSRGCQVEVYHNTTEAEKSWGIRGGGPELELAIVALIALFLILFANLVHKRQNESAQKDRKEIIDDPLIPQSTKDEILNGNSKKHKYI